MPMVFRIMATIAERLVLRLSATAESNSIASPIGFSFCGVDGYAASDPQWSTDAYGWVFDGDYGFLKVRFNRLASFLIVNDESSRGAVTSLLDCCLLHLRIV